MKVAPSDACFPAQMRREGEMFGTHQSAVPGGAGLPRGRCGEGLVGGATQSPEREAVNEGRKGVSLEFEAGGIPERVCGGVA